MEGRGRNRRPAEVKQRAVQQMRRLDVGERAENVLHAARVRFFPCGHHLFHLDPRAALRAAQIAWNDGKFAP